MRLEVEGHIRRSGEAKSLQIHNSDSKSPSSMEILSIPPSSISTNSILCKCTRRFAAFPFTITLLIFLVLPAAGDTAISYSAHCGDVVQEAPVLPNPNPPLPSTKFLSLRQAHVECRGNNTSKGISVIPRSLSLSSHKAYTTQNDAVFRIEAVVTLIGVEYSRNSTRRGLRLVHFRPPRIPVTPGDARKSNSFSLNGFWDSISGKLCMIGSGFGVLSSTHVVLKLDYLNSSTIFTSLANGTLESLDVNNESGYNLKSISILGVNLRNYKYELIDKEIENNGFRLLDDMTNVSLRVEDLGRNVCKYIRTAGALQLDYKYDCNSANCNFLGGRNRNFMPSTVYFKEIECQEDGRVRFLLVFGDFRGNGYWLPFEPNVTLVTEGKWDMENRRLNMVGCRIFSDWDEGLVGECLIRLSLRFPAQWTLRDRSAVVGELWSSRRVNESGYFARVTLASIKNTHIRSVALRYDYTEIENTRRSCANKMIKKAKEGKYPNALSSDMRFDMVVGNRKVRDFWGYSSPLFVGNQLYRLSNVFGQEDKYTLLGTQNLSNVINVSYVLSLSTSRDFKLSSEFMQIKSFEISAEGIYDSKSGHLCMTGCMHVGAPKVRLRENSSLDCEVLVDIQYPPLRASNGVIVKGTIESTRAKSDRLYFEPFEIFSQSIYAGKAKESIWRMDLEFTMVLISNTLSCIFMGLQLLHVKRHADVLPFISIIMLIVLTLAHMVPLLLNFEALLRTDRNNVNVYFGSDGWVEVNEVLVRVITMIAFLLEFRLLQMAWSARSGDESQKNLWVSDKKVLYISLPMYIGGGLIAWFVHLSKKSSHSPSLGIHRLGYKQQSLWGDLKSYAGLTLDGFLLPQILFNLFSDAKEKALASSFYIGATFIRLLPHAYDLYRSHSSSWSFNYIYANPRMDYYSTTWDIIISVGGFSFVVLVYLQQRYGGRCLLLPMRFWPRSTYEKVPVGNTV